MRAIEALMTHRSDARVVRWVGSSGLCPAAQLVNTRTVYMFVRRPLAGSQRLWCLARRHRESFASASSAGRMQRRAAVVYRQGLDNFGEILAPARVLNNLINATAPLDVSAHAKEIVGTALAAGSFEASATALKVAGLVDTLNGKRALTVFAPTDEALASVPHADFEVPLKDKPKLTAVVPCYVVAGKVLAQGHWTRQVQFGSGRRADSRAGRRRPRRSSKGRCGRHHGRQRLDPGNRHRTDGQGSKTPERELLGAAGANPKRQAGVGVSVKSWHERTRNSLAMPSRRVAFNEHACSLTH